MRDTLLSAIRGLWPFAGALYLAYLATLAPPGRYVGLVGLVFVLPLLAGKTVGVLFGVGPWATDGSGRLGNGAGDDDGDD